MGRDLSGRLTPLWDWLTRPSDSITDLERRSQAYLLAAILIALVPVALVVIVSRILLDPSFSRTTMAPSAAGLAVLMAAYAFSRSRFAMVGSVMAVLATFGVVVWVIVLDPRPESVRIALSFLALVVLLGSLLFRLHGTVILAIGLLLLVVLFPLVLPSLSWAAALTTAGFLSLICSLTIVTALLRRQARRQVERQAQELAIIHRVSTAAATSLEPHRVLELTCHELTLAFGVSQARALLLTEDGRSVTVVAQFNQQGDTSDVGRLLPLDANPVTRHVLTHREPMAIADLQTDPRTTQVHERARQQGVASLLALPLLAGDQIVGAVNLESNQRRVYKADEIRLAARATGAAAKALGHARLYAAEQEARRLSDTLGNIARELALAPDLDTALDLILARMEQVISFDSGSVLLLEGEVLRVVAVRGFPSPEEVLGRRLDLSLALLNREVIENRQPMIIESVADDPRWLQTMRDAGLVHALEGIHSWLGVPLIIQDRVIGMLTADKRQAGFYRSRDAELALAFAGHAAVTIENARLLESERTQLRLARTLQEVGALLTTRLGLPEVLERIYDLLARIVTYDSVSVQLLDGQGAMELISGRGIADMERARDIVRQVASQTLEVRWGESRFIVVRDTLQDARWRPVPGSEHIRSWIGAALLVRGRVLGVLNVDSTTPAAYDDAAGETVAAFANQAAIAIENARLYQDARQELAERERVEQEHRRLLGDLERRSRQLQTAADVSKSASTILDPQLLMQQTVGLIRDRFDFYYVGIFLVDGAGRYAVLQAGTGQAGRQMLVAGHRLEVGGSSMIGWSVAHSQARIALDVGQEAVRFENPFLSATRSEMALPLVSRGRCLGALTVQSDQPAAFSQEDVAVLQTMADHLAVAIENARLYEAAQVEIARRGQAEEAIRQLNESLERRVTERTAELAAVNRELEAFAFSVSHDLRAPLRRIQSFARALREDYSRHLDAPGLDYLERLEAASQQMTQIVEALLNLTQISRHELRRETIDLSRLARRVAEELTQTQEGSSADFVIANDLSAQGDEHLVRIVLENLMGNALKFTASQPHPRIEVGALWQDEDGSAFFVRDNGVGFDMAYADRLFAPFQRLHSAAEFEGTGIGLATVQRIVHRHGGRVWAEGSVGQGATVFFVL